MLTSAMTWLALRLSIWQDTFHYANAEVALRRDMSTIANLVVSAQTHPMPSF